MRATALANSRQWQLKDSRTAINGALHTAAKSVPTDDDLLGVRYVTETGLGVSTRSWSLALETDTYDFAASPFSVLAMRDALLAMVASQDEKVTELSQYATSSDGDRYCSYLKRRSRMVLQDTTAAEPDALASSAQ
jgi:hypothetical protein